MSQCGRNPLRDRTRSATFDGIPHAVTCGILALLGLRDFMRMRCVSTTLNELTRMAASAPREASLVVCAQTSDGDGPWVTRHDALRGISALHVCRLTLTLPIVRNKRARYDDGLSWQREPRTPRIDVRRVCSGSRCLRSTSMQITPIV
jgi:hypothetical protein